MKKFNYSDLSFIESALTFYVSRMTCEMRGTYSDDDIGKFESSVYDVIKKVIKLKEEV